MEIEVVRNPAARLAADAVLAAQLDALSERSAVAQQLGRAITSSALFASAQQRQQTLYIARSTSSGEALGYLKTGVKHLFYVVRDVLSNQVSAGHHSYFTVPYRQSVYVGGQNTKGEYSELDPLCILDFYISEEHQRSGVGLQLFQRLLQSENVEPRQLAYDRPSPKLIAFLRKHCELTEFFAQPNNFVIFDDYFST